jgi:nucleoid DNA-binding protein
MEEIIKMITEKVGLSADKAKSVVEMVVKFLSEKLPAPVASQITGLLSGDVAGKLADVAKEKSNLLGNL